jgi:LEA14-like dessication related protein
MKKYLYVVLVLAFTNISCTVYQTAVNVSRLKFKLDKVNNYTVSGIPVEGKRSIKDFSPFELLRITGNITKRTFPVSFIVNVSAKNPNDSTGGYPRTDIILKSFPFKLYIDDKETIDGNIDSPVSIPGTGEIVNIPVRIDVDLFRFFSDKDYKQLINLVFAIAGSNGYSSSIKLYAHPTVTTPFGDITYPGDLKIVSKEFTN